jgi:hypothetical protein
MINNRALKKEDTDTKNFRNRLLSRCESSVRKKDGSLPSSIKGLVQLVLRTWSNIRYGQNESLGIRDRVITVGLKKVLNHDVISKGSMLTGSIMESRFMMLSNYCSKVRVMASLLANFIAMEAFAEGEMIEIDEKFYSGCLQASRSGMCKAQPHIKEAFDRFCTSTGMIPETKMAGVSTLFERQVRPLILSNSALTVHLT